MKKRTYTLPVIITLLMIAGVAFLIFALTVDPYEQAIKKGDTAMAEFNYRKAVSEYTIAQNINENQIEPYHKALKAIALASEGTLVRDALTTINNCIEFCGNVSIGSKQIIEAIDILVENDNIKAAYDILNHLHVSLSEDEDVKAKFEEVSLLLNHSQPAPTPSATPVPSPVLEPLPEQIPVIEVPTQAPIPTQSPIPSQTPQPTPTPSATPTPTPAQTPSATPSPSATSPQTATPAPSQTQNPV